MSKPDPRAENIVVLPCGTLVRRTPILCSRAVVFTAWAPQSSPTGGCGTISSEVIDGRVQWYGRIGTERLPADVDAIPAWTGGRYNEARGRACDEFRAARNALAYRAILAAFPEAACGSAHGGEIEIWSDAS